MQLVHRLQFDNLRGDLFGGLTAAIVALPLALAFGVTSGAGAIAGLYGAVFTGFFAALFGGTPSQVSGPTGPMTVVMATVFAKLVAENPENGMAMAFTAVILSGMFQIVFGVLRLGQFITLMPYTVISGFMSGIGVIIVTLQLAPLLGYPAQSGVVSGLQQLPEALANPQPGTAGLGILTLAIVFGWSGKLAKLVPSPLVALIVCTAVSALVFPNSDIALIGDIPQGFPQLQWPRLNLSQIGNIVGYGLMLATLGAIDSLLTSLVADNITRTRHNSEQELIGQGIGNLLSGLFGGLPGAGATMRTVINVQAGGRTPLSGMFHALILLCIVLWAGEITAQIPHAVLAGILIKVGIQIIDWSFLWRVCQVSMRAALVTYGVLLLTVFVDLITAVVVGAFVANMLTIHRLTSIQVEQVRAVTDPDDDPGVALTPEERQLMHQGQGRIMLIQMSGPMSYGAARTIAYHMGRDCDALILDLSHVPLVGVTAAMTIEAEIRTARRRLQHKIYIVGATGQVKERLRRFRVQKTLPAENFLPSCDAALALALGLPEAGTSTPVPMVSSFPGSQPQESQAN
ncbi:SulP family inorganic anion transporter [Romeria aff. gracilis LEGE 07310]|uniref:SulP family inorganic anion transporter n=1 Tax=Vasconcelosia minhoensis LEGE 07310 TaxID=915328 RepID=A0A8J7ASW9_9CYAN|nr:SulP family inorganic anion transporter [Romeria gracilis]MBE9079800.1 SulP family inorganic anion transporter [Romeria aff. gracilis LEGE 07310]